VNQRERMLLIVIGAGIGVFALYQGVRFVFISPITNANTKISDLTRENERLKHLTRSRAQLVRDWKEAAARTISFDAAESLNRFGQDLKLTAKRSGFDSPVVIPAGRGKIGSKTEISSVIYRVTVEGSFDHAMAFLNELYSLPYLTQINRLSMVPLVQKSRGRNDVKLEFSVETPVLPKFDPKKMADAAEAQTMLEKSPPPTTPAREILPDEQSLAILKTRNIFRAYMPPSPNVVKIDNQDLKTADLKLTFYWEGVVSEQLSDTVAGKSQKPLTGKGDVVEIQGTYADKVKFGPERLDFNLRKDATYVIKSHTPAPPPEVIDLAVDNQAKDPVDLEVTLTQLEGKTKVLPTMRIKPGRMDIDEYKVKSVKLVATYASGKKASAMSFNPKSGKQTYVIPVEGSPVVPTQPIVAAGDPPPDPTMSVSGLVTYNGTQEMVGMAGGTRKVFTAGIESSIDGGMLLGVHPLGGVVRMPSGNYYLYPLGRKFVERVMLTAAHEEELAAAIDACAADLAALSAAPTATGSPNPILTPGARQPVRPQLPSAAGIPAVTPGGPAKMNGRPR
jgi:hypothetical protein